MFIYRLEHRYAIPVRLAAFALIAWSIFASTHHPGTSGRGLVVSLMLVGAGIAWLLWTAWPRGERLGMTAPVLMAATGGVLIGAAAPSAASAFVFVAVVAAGVPQPLRRAA